MDPSAATMMSITATPAPDQALSLAPINNNGTNIKSVARKLPIKRKIPPTSQPQTQPQPQILLDPVPIIINPLSLPLDPCPDPSLTASSLDNNDDDDDDNNESSRFSTIHSSNQNHQQQQPQPPPPFKYVRVWSESDEIRFLQGLLGCASRGLVFPRDLNVFYDTFSESMPEPFTRTQLYEKLRRLRNKFHLLSARIDAGLDPDRLAPHDRDLLHLCTRLWHPKFASTSPFSADASTTSASPPSGSKSQNKRRRRSSSGSSSNTLAAAAPFPLPTPMESEPAKEEEEEEREGAAKPMEMRMAHHVRPSEETLLPKTDVEYAVAKAVLDVFEGALEEMRTTLERDDDDRLSEGNVAGLQRRWKELRVAELDVFARRLRLVLGQSLIAS